MNYGFQTSTTGGQYVYYNRLRSDKSADNNALGWEALLRVLEIEGARDIFRTGASGQLMALAQAEREKEKSFLQNVFEDDYVANYDIKKPNADKEITEAINKVLSLHKSLDAYNRAKTRLLDKNQVFNTPTKIFDNKFEDYWDLYSNDLANICAKTISVRSNLITPIRNFVIKVARAALEDIFDLKAMSNSGEDTAVYQDLKDSIGDFGGGGLLDELYRAYNLEAVVKEIEQQIRGIGNKADKKVSKRMTAAAIGKTRVHQKNGPSSGKFYESVEAEILGKVATSINGIKMGGEFVQVEVKVDHTGGLNAKADNIMTFGVDISPIRLALENYQNEDRSNRVKNVTVFDELNKKLQGTGDGYVVYFNDKDYMFGRNFKGFSAGDAQTLANFKNTFGARVDGTLIEGILQTMSGAVGEDLKGTLSEALASDVAMWLFDDFDTIGSMPEQSTPSSLHIMSLDGIYVPLSVFLNKLALAFNEVEADVSKMVRVDIDSGAIAYPHGYDRRGHWGWEAWDAQAAKAQTQIKISVHFLNNFKSFIGGL